MGMKLFDSSDCSDEDTSKIEIDPEFARRYEHNKRREDLQRLQELKKKGLVDDLSSESDDEEEGAGDRDLIDSKKDLEFFNALIRVKHQDPELKNGESKLFESESELESESESGDEGGAEGKGNKKKQPKYLKDVMATHLMEAGPEFEDKEETKLPAGLKSYSQEQEEVRKAVIDAAQEGFDSDGDDVEEFFKVKEGGNNLNGETNLEVDKKMDEYFGEDKNLDKDTVFLKNFFRNRMWLEEKNNDGAGKMELNEDGRVGVSEDEEEIERQEDYERGYNFRFEENAGDRVMGHPRFVEGSVRKTTRARQLQRKSKEERMALAEFERKEELKHLKNLKKKEINEKLRKIRETAGIGEKGVCALDANDLDEDFDPDEYDRKMKEAFDDDYYHADDADPQFGSDDDEGEFEKPDFDKEDELLGLPKGWDEVFGSVDGFLATRKRNLKGRLENETDQEQVQDKEERDSKKGKVEKKHSPEEEKLRQELLEEYYKLDYEDTIGDLKTRFKYKSVNPKRYGLNTEEIFLLDDKELNQYVSLKKLAPYREKEWKVPRIKTYNQKQRNRALLLGETTNAQDISRTKLRAGPKSTGDVDVSKDKLQMDESHTDQNNLSRRSKRKRCQAELKLSRSRLIAYGKISTKSKKKK